MKCEFDPASHTYKIDGIIVPSVTQVLKEAGFYSYEHVNQDVLQRAAHFGSAVHRACALEDVADLEHCAGEILPYLDAWRNFKKDAGITGFDLIEEPLYSDVWKFAGTPDRYLAELKTIIDIKTGMPEPWHSLQTAGYAVLLTGKIFGERPRPKKPGKRLTVYLNPDRYRVCEHKEPGDENIFLGALKISHWKRNNNARSLNETRYCS